MAVGKGSMARASRAAKKTGEVKSVVINNPGEEPIQDTEKKTSKRKAQGKEEADVKAAQDTSSTLRTNEAENKSEVHNMAHINHFVMIGEEMPVHYL